MLPTWAQAGGPPRSRAAPGRPATGATTARPPAPRNLTDGIERGAPGGLRRDRRPVATSGRASPTPRRREARTIGDFAMRVLDEEDPLRADGLPPRRRRRSSSAGSIRRTIRHPRMMVASDGIYHGQSIHPRGYGCFARVLRLCVRETGRVSLETAIHKMSGFPAERFRIKDRGSPAPRLRRRRRHLRPGPRWPTARPGSEPRLAPVGIDRVLVNGADRRRARRADRRAAGARRAAAGMTTWRGKR